MTPDSRCTRSRRIAVFQANANGQLPWETSYSTTFLNPFLVLGTNQGERLGRKAIEQEGCQAKWVA